MEVHPAQGAAAVPVLSSDAEPQPLSCRARAQKLFKNPSFRAIAARILLRLIVLGTLVALIKSFGKHFRSAGDAYLDYVHGAGSVTGPVVFLICATLFCAVSPLGYLPAVISGITFEPQAAIPITYLSVVIGALLNTLAVRGFLYKVGCVKRYYSRSAARRGAMMSTVQRLLAAHPVKMVILLRLPFMGNGFLNYLFSFSTLPLGPMTLGNAVGLIPGSVLFSVAGSQVRSLATLIADPASATPTTIGILVGVSCTVAASLICVLLISRRFIRSENAAAAAAAAATPASPAACGASGAAVPLVHDGSSTPPAERPGTAQSTRTTAEEDVEAALTEAAAPEAAADTADAATPGSSVR